MSTVVDFIFGSSNKKNAKTNSVNKNIPEIASAKKTLSELINKIIKLIAEKNELQEELNKMKKNKELKETQEANKKAQEKNSKSLLDQIVKFDGYLSNIHESLSKEDTEKLLTGIQAKIRNNKALNTQIANTIKLNRNNSHANATPREVVEEVKEVFQQNNSKRNIKKSPESLEELLGISKNNRALNSRVNNRAANSHVNNRAANSRVNNRAANSHVNNSEPRVNNNVSTRNKELSKGLSSIAGIFLNQNKKMNAQTYNELSKLSSSIKNLEQ
jgi:hypothetical protein